MMILELHRQGVSITAIARRTGREPKTIRKYLERGVEAPAYGPRRAGRPSKLAAYLDFLRERVRQTNPYRPFSVVINLSIFVLIVSSTSSCSIQP